MYGESNVEIAVEARIGAINKINGNVISTTHTAKNIASRIHELRARLIMGHASEEIGRGNQPSAPEPVRSEVEELEHSVDVLSRVLSNLLDDLSALEAL